MQVLLEAGTNATAASFLPDRHQVVVGYGGGEAKVWDWTAPKNPQRFGYSEQRLVLGVVPAWRATGGGAV